MTKNLILKNENILLEQIKEQDIVIKYLFNVIIGVGAFGFLIVGLSSYLNYNIIPILEADQIIFFPQGITMCFYGICGIIVSINQFRILLSNFGEGYNEFNKEEGIVKIFRKGFTNKNSDVNIIYPLTDIVR
jgi:hypothetical protein